MIVPLEHVIALSLALFSIGVLGVLFRRNAITIFMSIELMLNAVNLALVGFSRYYNSVDGQVFVFLVMALAAAEVAVGLAIIIALYRNRQTVNIGRFAQIVPHNGRIWSLRHSMPCRPTIVSYDHWSMAKGSAPVLE